MHFASTESTYELRAIDYFWKFSGESKGSPEYPRGSLFRAWQCVAEGFHYALTSQS